MFVFRIYYALSFEIVYFQYKDFIEKYFRKETLCLKASFCLPKWPALRVLYLVVAFSFDREKVTKALIGGFQ